MLDMVRDLLRHKGYANAALLQAIGGHPPAASDPEIGRLLHHILIANRVWVLTVLGLPFVHDDEARTAASFAEIVERYRRMQEQETEWLASATDSGLTRVLASPLIPNGRCTVAEAWLQGCLHSQGHRSQVAMRLRQRGGVPPAADFILWAANRAEPEWP
jgi:uncharacterized damage-inducible protein DinB